MAYRRKQFTFYESFWQAVQSLPEEERYPTLEAIIDYALEGREHLLFGMADTVFKLIRPTLDSSRKKAESGHSGAQSREANRKQTASKPQANEKQTASKDTSKDTSKPQANEKQTASKDTSKPQANEKQTACKGEGEREEEGDIEVDIEVDIEGEREIEDECPIYGAHFSDFSPGLSDAVSAWFSHCRELGQAKSDTGERMFLSQVNGYAHRYGEQAVTELISTCISSGYKSVYFDRLDKEGVPRCSSFAQMARRGRGEG